MGLALGTEIGPEVSDWQRGRDGNFDETGDEIGGSVILGAVLLIT